MSQTAQNKLNLSNNSKGSAERIVDKRSTRMQNKRFSPDNYQMLKTDMAKDSKLKSDPKYMKLVEQI